MMPSFFARADAMLLSLKSSSEQLDCVVPARLQSYMSAAKPVFAMIGKGGAEVISEASAGYSVAPGDYMEMAKIIRLSLNKKEELLQKGDAGRLYFDHYFAKDICIDNLCRIIEKHS